MAVTANILQRTFQIRFGHSTGTCFTVDVDNRRYLVTARHLVSPTLSLGTVDILHDGKWKSLAVELVGHGQGPIDITVLAPQSVFGAQHSLVVTTANLQLAEDVYFLGFPYGLKADIRDLNAGFPLPLVKHAIVSAMDPKSGRILLDGHNNPGFSGGPVVRRWDGHSQVVVGVVSSYFSKPSRVVDDSDMPGPYNYSINTGIVSVYDSRMLNEIIAANPIGAELH